MTTDPIPEIKQQVAAALKTQMARHYDPAAALLLGIDCARVSDLRRGRLNRFSLETLIRYDTRLGIRIELRLALRRGGEATGPGA